MNKTELTAAVAAKAFVSQAAAAKVINAFCEQIAESLSKGESVQILGFGTFEVAEYGPRKGRNPATGEEMEIPAGRRPKFTAGASLKKAVG